ncbi:MAG: TetR family transcriptional regulator, partial [Pseudoclavibacter sp.]
MTSRDRMLRAAALEMLEKGYAGATLSSIAARLELTKGALARQFPSKHEFAVAIMNDLHESVKQQAVRARGTYPDSGIRALVHHYVGIATHMATSATTSAAFTLLADRSAPSTGLRDVLDTIESVVQGFIEQAIELGELPSTT